MARRKVKRAKSVKAKKPIEHKWVGILIQCAIDFVVSLTAGWVLWLILNR